MGGIGADSCLRFGPKAGGSCPGGGTIVHSLAPVRCYERRRPHAITTDSNHTGYLCARSPYHYHRHHHHSYLVAVVLVSLWPKTGGGRCRRRLRCCPLSLSDASFYFQPATERMLTHTSYSDDVIHQMAANERIRSDSNPFFRILTEYVSLSLSTKGLVWFFHTQSH